MKPVALHTRLPVSVTLQWMHHWPLYSTDCMIKMRCKACITGCPRSSGSYKAQNPHSTPCCSELLQYFTPMLE